MVSCPWALSFCIFIRFVFVFADVCVQSEKCGKIKFRWTRLGVGGADWSISRRGRSFSTSGSRPAPGHCPPRLSLSRSTQIQTRLVPQRSLLFRRLKYHIITRDLSWYQLFLELYHATSLFWRLCKLEVWYHVDEIMLFLFYVFFHFLIHFLFPSYFSSHIFTTSRIYITQPLSLGACLLGWGHRRCQCTHHHTHHQY